METDQLESIDVDGIRNLDSPAFVICQQTGGSHEGKIHAVPFNAQGQAGGEWGDNGQYYVAHLRPSTVADLVEVGVLDEPIGVLDVGSDAPWTFVKRKGLVPPESTDEPESTGTIDLTSVKGISDAIAGRVRESVDVEKLQASAEIDPSFVDRSVLTDVKGISEKRAESIVEYLADPSNFEGESESADGADLTDAERADRVREQILDGASTEDIVTCIPNCEKRDLRNAQDDMSAPELKKHKGVLKDAIALVS